MDLSPQLMNQEPQIVDQQNDTCAINTPQWSETEWSSQCSQTEGMTLNKTLIKKPETKLRDANWSKQDIRMVAGLATGHCNLKKHAYIHRKMIKKNRLCRLCEQVKSSVQFFSKCQANKDLTKEFISELSFNFYIMLLLCI